MGWGKRGGLHGAQVFETIELERFMPRIPPYKRAFHSLPLKQLKQCGGLISEAGQIKITAFDCALLLTPLSPIPLPLTASPQRGSFSPRVCFANWRHILPINCHQVKLIWPLLNENNFLRSSWAKLEVFPGTEERLWRKEQTTINTRVFGAFKCASAFYKNCPKWIQYGLSWHLKG